MYAKPGDLYYYDQVVRFDMIPKPNLKGEHSAYCAFKNDQLRLKALRSRDVRLVVIVLVLAFMAPNLKPQLVELWATVVGTKR